MRHSNKMQRYHSLDIVRGLAALSVLLSHWGSWTFAYTDATSKYILVLYQNAFKFLLGGAYTQELLYLLC